MTPRASSLCSGQGSASVSLRPGQPGEGVRAGLPKAGSSEPSVARMPPGLARTSNSSGNLVASKRSRVNHGQLPTYPIENAVMICATVSSPEIRAKVMAQLSRLRHDRRRRYDPAKTPHIISKRLHILKAAVDEILQGTCLEYVLWMREVRGGQARVMADADSKANALWLARPA